MSDGAPHECGHRIQWKLKDTGEQAYLGSSGIAHGGTRQEAVSKPPEQSECECLSQAPPASPEAVRIGGQLLGPVRGCTNSALRVSGPRPSRCQPASRVQIRTRATHPGAEAEPHAMVAAASQLVV